MNENSASSGKQRRRRRSPEEWTKLVAEWKSSGHSASEFARERNVGESSLWKWDFRLRAAVDKRRQASPSPRSPTKFVAVEVKGSQAPEQRKQALPGRIEISLPSGAVVRLRGNVAPEAFSTVIQTLAREWSC
jgi:transposase-like protein